MNFDPMLATSLDYERHSFPRESQNWQLDGQPTFAEQQFQWDAEVKLDGIRAILYMDGENTRLLTRVKGKHTGEYANKINHLPWFIHPHPGLTLDGELTWGRNSRECMEVLGCSPSEAIRRQEESRQLVKFTAFDLLTASGKDVRFRPYEERRELLTAHVHGLMEDNSNIDAVMPGPARALWARGGEGIMLKAPMHTYQCGRRSPDWLKVKRSKRYIVVVTTFNWGKQGKTGNMVGKMGSLSISMVDVRGILISVGDVGTGFSMEERHAGAWPPRTVIEVESSDVTEDGKLWHPRFIRRRPDLGAEDASLGQLA